ncbi:MAG TPA: DNA polymerase, partial [Caulobacteraceae bacterium]|nr:DNA polymerase [Caulobacteraceae bacterium]
AHRPPPPDDLIPQFPLVRDATRAFGVPSLELPGYEADDLIAAYACKVRDAGGEVVIVSSDKDLMQLVGPKVSMLDTMKNLKIGHDQVVEKFGVPPNKVVDVQALCGDSVDNVPGAPGIGIKTASALINEYGDLDSLLARAGEIKQDKRRQTLIDFADQIRLSRQLVQLDCDTPLPQPIDELAVEDPDPAVLAEFLERMEFRTLARRVVESRSGGAPAPPPKRAEPEAPAPIDTSLYACIRDLAALDIWIARAREAGIVAFDAETDGPSSASSDLVGVSMALAPGVACYIPLGHAAGDGLALETSAELEQIPMAEGIARLKGLLEDPGVLKVGHNVKYDMAVFARLGVEVAPVEDTMLISYTLGGGLHDHGMEALADRWLSHQPITLKSIAGTGKAQKSLRHVEVSAATCYAAEDADITIRLYRLLRPRLAREGLLTVYETLERPLPKVLAQMELAGVRIDPDQLRRLSNDFSQRMADYEIEATEVAGRPFNLGSPKQIGDVLFGEMGLPGGKKTATGVWSTDASVLDQLAAEGHRLPRL